jgi:chromosome segregation ATPase
MPEDISDEILRSIQQRLHMNKVAQADADGSRNAVKEFHVHRRNLEAKNKTLRTESFALQSEIRALKEELDQMRTHMEVGEAATYASLTTEINSLKQTLKKERDATEKLAKVTKDEFATRAREVTSLIAKKQAFSSQVDTLTTEKHTLVAEKAEEVSKHAKLTAEIHGLEQTLEKERRQAEEAARVAKGKLTTNTTLTLRDTNLIAENTAVKLQTENLEREVKSVLQSLESYKMRLWAIANEP